MSRFYINLDAIYISTSRANIFSGIFLSLSLFFAKWNLFCDRYINFFYFKSKAMLLNIAKILLLCTTYTQNINFRFIGFKFLQNNTNKVSIWSIYFRTLPQLSNKKKHPTGLKFVKKLSIFSNLNFQEFSV